MIKHKNQAIDDVIREIPAEVEDLLAVHGYTVESIGEVRCGRLQIVLAIRVADHVEAK